MMAEGICPDTVANCVCGIAADVEHTRHACACGGEWERDADGSFTPWVMPGGREDIAHLTALAEGWKPGTR